MKTIVKKYPYVVVATDVVIFTVKDGQLQALLIKMKKSPFKDFWAAPGGLVKPHESVDDAAYRIVAEKAGVKNVFLEQLYTFGKAERDPFGRVVSVAYFALVPRSLLHIHTTAEYADIAWFPIKKLPKLAYDHAEVLKQAVKRLQIKLSYTNIIYSLLPENFSLSELQAMYEVVLARKLDKRNFRKKIQALGLVKNTGKKRSNGASRPAELFTFTTRKPMEIAML